MKITAEYTKRQENFAKEADFVFANTLMAIIADFMLTWLPAPTLSYRWGGAGGAGWMGGEVGRGRRPGRVCAAFTWVWVGMGGGGIGIRGAMATARRSCEWPVVLLRNLVAFGPTPPTAPCHPAPPSTPLTTLRPRATASGNALVNFFASCPDNAFQKVPPGMEPFSLSQRLGAILRNGSKLLGVGFCASLIGERAVEEGKGAYGVTERGGIVFHKGRSDSSVYVCVCGGVTFPTPCAGGLGRGREEQEGRQRGKAGQRGMGEGGLMPAQFERSQPAASALAITGPNTIHCVSRAPPPDEQAWASPTACCSCGSSWTRPWRRPTRRRTCWPPRPPTACT
mgnify:CR=1 FL=1